MKEKLLPRSKKLFGLLMFTISFLMLSLISLSQEVTVFTDKDDYWPGEWVIITGSGWTADDSVLITLTHIDPNIPNHSHDPWYVAPDADGYIYDEWFVLEEELGTAFHLTALGFNSGWVAETWFTDGQVKAKTQTSGITSTITYIVYDNPNDCSGTIATSGSVAITDGNTNIYNVGKNERLLITAAPYSDQGGIFQGWYNTNNLLLTTDLSFCTDNSLTNIVAQYSEECTPPTAYTVTGAGAYCAGAPGLAVGLALTQTGVNYQLYLDGTTAIGSPVAGTGAAISFGIQPAGTYTIVATRLAGGCTTNMNGSAVVIENTIDPGEIAKGATNPGPGCGTLNPNFAGTVASGSTDASGSGPISYQWEDSTDESIWTEISGATEISFNIPTISETTYYRRVATSTLNGVACSATSNVLEYEVNPLPEVSSITPVGTTEVCVNATLQLSNATVGGVWSSSDETLATVDETTGLVTGITEGTVTISYTDTNEFDCSKSANKTVHVYALPDAPTANHVTVTYDGTEQTASATIPTGILIDWYTTENGTNSTTAPTGTNAGTYTAWAEARNETTGCVSSGRTEVTLEIEKRPITITADAKTKVYGEDDEALTYQITTGSLAFSDAFTGTLTREIGENVGDYEIQQGSVALNSNYTLTYVPANYSITLRPVTITADAKTKVYGEDDEALTYQTTTGSLAFSDAFTGALTRETGEEVGAYEIQQGTVELNSNYTLTYVPANYSITLRAVEITADAKTKVYGEDDEALTYQITTGSLAFSDAFTGTLTREIGENVGDYEIQQGTVELNSNYTLTYVPANYSITQAVLTVTAGDASKYCGQVNPTFTVSYDGFVNGEDESVLGGALIFTTAADEYSTGASYSVTPSGLTSGNYAITFEDGNLTISGVTIDASASSNPVNINDTYATLSATVSPVVSGVLVNFYLDDVWEADAWTNANGTATLQVEVSSLSVNVYKVTAEAGGGCAEDVAYMPIYDPSAGFVTGGGWIMSPAGAYTADESLTGKANFGFVAKYKKGKTATNEVDGNTEFQFKAGNLNFKSQFHESGSLVISGKKATYRGEGTINGSGNFKFTLVAIDGDWNDGTDPDQFRIKIWGDNGIVYDNGLGADDNSDASTALGGGSIVIHEVKSNGKKAAEIMVANEVESSSFLAYPNPFTDRLKFEFSSPVATDARLDVYDATGRLVKVVFDQPVEGGVNYNAEFVPNSNMSNLYIYRLTLGAEVINGKVLYTK